MKDYCSVNNQYKKLWLCSEYTPKGVKENWRRTKENKRKEKHQRKNEKKIQMKTFSTARKKKKRNIKIKIKNMIKRKKEIKK